MIKTRSSGPMVTGAGAPALKSATKTSRPLMSSASAGRAMIASIPLSRNNSATPVVALLVTEGQARTTVLNGVRDIGGLAPAVHGHDHCTDRHHPDKIAIHSRIIAHRQGYPLAGYHPQACKVAAMASASSISSLKLASLILVIRNSRSPCWRATDRGPPPDWLAPWRSNDPTRHCQPAQRCPRAFELRHGGVEFLLDL